jgi:hypothetical protein
MTKPKERLESILVRSMGETVREDIITGLIGKEAVSRDRLCAALEVLLNDHAGIDMLEALAGREIDTKGLARAGVELGASPRLGFVLDNPVEEKMPRCACGKHATLHLPEGLDDDPSCGDSWSSCTCLYLCDHCDGEPSIKTPACLGEPDARLVFERAQIKKKEKDMKKPKAISYHTRLTKAELIDLYNELQVSESGAKIDLREAEARCVSLQSRLDVSNAIIETGKAANEGLVKRLTEAETENGNLRSEHLRVSVVIQARDKEIREKQERILDLESRHQSLEDLLVRLVRNSGTISAIRTHKVEVAAKEEEL